MRYQSCERKTPFDNYQLNAERIWFEQKCIDYIPPLHMFVNLTQLNIRYNKIRELPSVWPNTLEILDCSHNQIRVIRSLPPALLWFDCSYNEISTICPLPPRTRIFACKHNQVNELPPLSEDLVSLYASYNAIKQLPILPLDLIILECAHNQIQQLPELPTTLRTLMCNDNPMPMFPRIPTTVNVVILNNVFMQWMNRVPSQYEGQEAQYAYNVWTAFREAYYTAKYRRPLRDALWRIREKHAMEDMHPSVIERMLDEGIDIDDIRVRLVSK